MPSPSSPKHQVEALLFSSGKAMALEQIAQLAKLDVQVASRALKALQKEYADRDGALEVMGDAAGWKMTVRADQVSLVKNIVADTELSRACMETLAVIAYKHPNAMQSEVVDTRGGNAYEHIAELERLGFVRKEPSGRSFKLKLTEKFFSYFDVHGDKEIAQVFANVQLPVKEQQTTLGEMEVVSVDEKPPQGPVDGMEVVSVPKAQQKQKDLPAPPELRPEPAQDEAHRKFLDDLDARIAAIGKRNDEHANDPLFKSKLPTTEGQDADSPSTENTEETEKNTTKK
jgi:segregation and condensation protein B